MRILVVVAGFAICYGFAIPGHAQTGGSLTVRVRDGSTGEPVPQAQVVIANRFGTTAGDGTLTLHSLPAGEYLVAVRRIGFTPRNETVAIHERGVARLEVQLRPTATSLPPVTVEEHGGYLGGFWERRARDIGHFITREDLARRNPARLVEVFYGVAGAQVVPAPRGYLVVSARGPRGLGGGQCIAAVFLDGRPYVMTTAGLNDIHPDHVEAIEYYSSPARVPPQFNSTGSMPRRPDGLGVPAIEGTPACGVVAIWLRRP